MDKKKKPTRNPSAEIDELERSFRALAGTPASESTAPNRKTRKGLIITIVIASFLLISTLAGYFYITRPLPSDTTVAGIHVGGMNIFDATAAVNGSDIFQKTFTVTINGREVSISPQIANVQLDAQAALLDALFKGTTGGALDISAYLNIDKDAIIGVLNETENQYFATNFQESEYSVTGVQPDLTQPEAEGEEGQKLVLKKGVLDYAMDKEQIYRDILSCYAAGIFQLEHKITVKVPKALDIEAIYQELAIAPVDAVIDPETFEVSAHSYGYHFDLDNAKGLFNSAHYGDVIEIPFVRIEPEATYEEVSSILFRDVLGTYTAYASSQPGRDTNLYLSCKAINGIVLMPGEVFSYNPALGERTPDKGWDKADGYVGNQTVSQYGGGICQASSCLYLSAMLADLEIVERVNHGFISSYMPFGMDATVSWGGPEFLFKNSTEYPIRIEAEAYGGTVRVALVGTDTKDYYVKMTYEVLEKVDYETVEVELPPDNEEGYKDGDVIITPYTGYTIVTYRCKYDKETDKLISCEEEVVSKYNKRDKEVCKIVDPDATNPTETTVPETTEPETTEPDETTAPVETTEPIETTVPADAESAATEPSESADNE